MIELKNLCVSFGEQSVLRNFCASIPTDRNTAIYGASGSGKTTLLRLLLGLIRPDAGTITGTERSVLSAVFQEDRLLPWLTAAENVALVSDMHTAERLLARLRLNEAMQERPGQLSGGMKRRVAIARALAFPCDLLLMDEPFNGLDTEAKEMTARVILDAKKPVVLVTHNREDAALLAVETVVTL